MTKSVPSPSVPTKHAFDAVPVPFDWHDFLANDRPVGTAVALNFVFRPLRAQANGLQYRCTTAGVTSGAGVSMPTTVGGTVVDGTATWTAEALSTDSLRATISSHTFSAPSDLTLTDEGSADLVYTVQAAGGVSRMAYELVHEVVLSDGEQYEATARIAVKD